MTDEVIKATITITGNASNIIGELKKIRHTEACSIKLNARVKYPNNRIPQWYSIPIIQEGNITEAKQSLEKLFLQRAITGEQFDAIEKAILDAEEATRAKHFE